jgi:hypothetical protein
MCFSGGNRGDLGHVYIIKRCSDQRYRQRPPLTLVLRGGSQDDLP